MPPSNLEINVTFIDASNESVIGTTYLPLDQLPENFKEQKRTTLKFDNEEWDVIEAIPATAKEFSKTAALTVKVSKLDFEASHAHELLYSLPTLANKLPFMDTESMFDAFVFEIQEDNWRLAEFLPYSELTEIRQELQAITIIWENHREETNDNYYAFNRIHVRSKIDTPQLNIDLDKLLDLLGSHYVGALKMTGQADGEYVEDGFAIHTPAGVFYGVTYDNRVQLLGVHTLTAQELVELEETGFPDEASAQQALKKLIEKVSDHYHLIFVDWYRCFTIPETTVIY